jgi:6-pyruvoyltetrahydropterin/6-carboxytetrahydropterin synthase
MYTVAVQRELIAQHFLIGGDFGPENHPHSHHYRVEVRLAGPSLDPHGFLVDIDEVSALLAGLLESYRDKTLNHLPEFQGLNPSLEHLCRILCRRLARGLQRRNLSTVTVTIWESDVAWAACTEELTCP